MASTIYLASVSTKDKKGKLTEVKVIGAFSRMTKAVAACKMTFDHAAERAALLEGKSHASLFKQVSENNSYYLASGHIAGTHVEFTVNKVRIR